MAGVTVADDAVTGADLDALAGTAVGVGPRPVGRTPLVRVHGRRQQRDDLHRDGGACSDHDLDPTDARQVPARAGR
jgi:hypothetical protein